MLPVVLSPEARAEFDEAFDWYEQQRAGLGVDFVARVQEVFDRISDSPEFYEQVFLNVRRGIVHRFPYLVLYQIEENQVLVLAVFHSKRDPKIWQTRTRM
jgi:plasmid stabilization system protein ParE